LADTATLDIPSDPKFLGLCRCFVQWAAKRAGFAEREARLIVLAVDEAGTNVIRHSYRGDVSQRIIVSCQWVSGERLDVRLKDFGQSVHPQLMETFEKTDKSKPGGLGLSIIRQVMDSVQYSPNRDDGIELCMSKQIPPSEEQ